MKDFAHGRILSRRGEDTVLHIDRWWLKTPSRHQRSQAHLAVRLNAVLETEELRKDRLKRGRCKNRFRKGTKSAKLKGNPRCVAVDEQHDCRLLTSQQALATCTPAWPMWMEMTSRLQHGSRREMCGKGVKFVSTAAGKVHPPTSVPRFHTLARTLTPRKWTHIVEFGA